MLVSEIVTDIIDTLRRPDLQSFVEVRARQQIKLLHSFDNFPRDKVEQTITIQNPGVLVRTALPPFWRKWDSIMPITYEGNRIPLPTDDVDWVGFREADPRKVMGYRDNVDTDFYYVAGDALNIKMSVAAPKLLVSYYVYPDLRSPNAVTWVTETFPELSTYRILMVCYRMLGNFEQAAAVEQLYQEALAFFISDASTAGAN